MKYSAVINAAIDYNIAYDALLPEQEKSFDRANWSMEKKDGFLKIIINAKDASALRALFNSVTRLLSVIEGIP